MNVCICAGDNFKHTVWLRIFNEACHARGGDRPPPVDRGSHGLSMKPPIAGGKGVWASYEPPMFGAIGLSSWPLVVAVVVCGWYKKYFLRKKPRTCHSERQKRHPICNRWRGTICVSNIDGGARARASGIMLHSLERGTPQSKGGGIYSMIWIGGGCACHVNFSIAGGGYMWHTVHIMSWHFAKAFAKLQLITIN